MGQFQATVRILDVTEPDAPTAVRTVEERLHKAGFNRCHVVSLHPQPIPIPALRSAEASGASRSEHIGGALLLSAIVAWALWLLWLIAS
jgi:hypothetical protein